MAHYAFLDENNVVTEVIVGIDETELIEGKHPEIWYSEYRQQKCKRTSLHGNIRKNYAGIDYTYNEDIDAFVPPKPYASWVLDEDTAQWVAPVDYPDDEKVYDWNEAELAWQVVDLPDTPSEITE